MAKNDLEKVKGQLKELSEIINSFKSEAVQLKLIDVIFQDKAFDLNPIPESKVSKKETSESKKETPQEENKPVVTGKKRGRKPGTKLTSKVAEVKNETSEPVVKVKGKPGRKPNPLKAEKVKASKEKKVKAKVKVKRTRVKSDRPGPSKMLDKLVDEGFFSQPRSIGDVTSFCKEVYGYEYKTTDLSGILMRMVRKSRLSRQTNEEKNQYEYFNYQA
jgi:hypothetical protein